jgi:hypothetical protein
VEFSIPELDPNSILPNINNLFTPYEDVNNRIPLGLRVQFGFEGPAFSNAYDPNIDHYIQSWLMNTVGNGEQAQIGRNDMVLKLIMVLAGVSPESFDRNLGSETTVGATRPDFSALANGVPLFIAEEKEGGNIQGSIGDVSNKFRWIPHFHRLPFYICFAACFNSIAVMVLRREMQPTTQIFPLITPQQRALFLRVAINVSRIFKYIVTNGLLVYNPLHTNAWHARPQGKSIRLSLEGVEVKCDITRQKDLELFYEACRAKKASKKSPALDRIPFIEYLNPDAPVQRNPCGAKNCHFYLLPFGASIVPDTFRKFCRAIDCVVRAIYGIHNRGWMHTDIR